MSHIPTEEGPTVPTQPKPASRWKRWHKITLGVIAGLFLLVLVGTFSGGEEPTAAPPAAETTTAAPPAQAPPPAAEPTETAEEPEALCPVLKLSKKEIKAINTVNAGLEDNKLPEFKDVGKAKSGYKVELSDDPGAGLTHVAALKVKGSDKIATVAFEDPIGDGFIIFVNDAGRKYFPWGVAMREGSPMDDARTNVELSVEHDLAVDCADGSVQ